MITLRLHAVEVLEPRSWRLAIIDGAPAVFTSKVKARQVAAAHRRIGTKARVVPYERGRPATTKGAANG